MTRALKIRKIGAAYGVILSKSLLDDLGLRPGDTLYPVRVPDGVRLTACDTDLEAALESNRDYMHRHRNALLELAKR
jgi:putative addiction module antidote